MLVFCHQKTTKTKTFFPVLITPKNPIFSQKLLTKQEKHAIARFFIFCSFIGVISTTFTLTLL